MPPVVSRTLAAAAVAKKARTPTLERWLYGDANRRRIDFVKERLVDITWGRKPDGDKYLDENGVKRPVPEGQLAPMPGDLDGSEPALSQQGRGDQVGERSEKGSPEAQRALRSGYPAYETPRAGERVRDSQVCLNKRIASLSRSRL